MERIGADGWCTWSTIDFRPRLSHLGGGALVVETTKRESVTYFKGLLPHSGCLLGVFGGALGRFVLVPTDLGRRSFRGEGPCLYFIFKSSHRVMRLSTLIPDSITKFPGPCVMYHIVRTLPPSTYEWSVLYDQPLINPYTRVNNL